jgi:hypothetical protein
MRLVSGVRHQKFWCVINGHVIHAALHGGKQVVIKMWYMNSLVYQKQERPPVRWVSVGHSTGNHPVFRATKSGVIGFNMDGLIIVLKDVSVPTQYTGVGMRVKF